MRTHATIPAWLVLRVDWRTYRSGPLWTYSALSLMADSSNEVTVSNRELAEAMGTEERTVHRHIDHLRDIGAITSSRLGRRTDPCTYTLHDEAPSERS